jgi:hypothetical protein
MQSCGLSEPRLVPPYDPRAADVSGLPDDIEIAAYSVTGGG